jgi:hypothetical protein
LGPLLLLLWWQRLQEVAGGRLTWQGQQLHWVPQRLLTWQRDQVLCQHCCLLLLLQQQLELQLVSQLLPLLPAPPAADPHQRPWASGLVHQ